jgi:hypothetical protein
MLRYLQMSYRPGSVVPCYIKKLVSIVICIAKKVLSSIYNDSEFPQILCLYENLNNFTVLKKNKTHSTPKLQD